MFLGSFKIYNKLNIFKKYTSGRMEILEELFGWFSGFPAFRTRPNIFIQCSIEYILFPSVVSQTILGYMKWYYEKQ